MKKEKVILVDCDGVLLDWLYAFEVWMMHQGFEVKDENVYEVDKRYGISKKQKETLVRFFNESAAIGFIPPLRDAIYYVKKLHEKHGYVFHCVTSLSVDPNAQELRKMNIEKLFGKGIFEKFVFLDTGADKDQELSQYEGKDYVWVEDKVENAQCGANFGLDSVLMEHSFNMNNTEFPLMKNWKDIYEYLT